jgi:hypothetical protein
LNDPDAFIQPWCASRFGSRYKHAQESNRSSIAVFAAEKLIGGRNYPAPDQIKELDSGAKLGMSLCCSIETQGCSVDLFTACMAVRLALEFNVTTFDSRVKEMEQVARHMRVCLTATEEFETVVTIAPSEPLLAEGAYRLMRRQAAFDLPLTLLKELESPGLDTGNRGVLVCLVLLTLARDAVVNQKWTAAIPLLDFIQSLLAHEWHEDVLSQKPAKSRCPEEHDKSLKETFAGSRIYFNHFIKVQDVKVINRKFLWALKY